ncbi:MAG: helix-turn-helix transcriptional regulator [Clostridia bacterium]|nr:helix-turn-helix transcriptional regulator [Clostridia bacterium]
MTEEKCPVEGCEELDAAPHCADTVVHDAVLIDVRASIPPDEHLYALADLYKVFGDSTRIRILYALFEAELCVCDIAELLSMSVSAISHQLRVLKQAKLVRYRRDGKTVYYSLADDHVRAILGQGMEHVEE